MTSTRPGSVSSPLREDLMSGRSGVAWLAVAALLLAAATVRGGDDSPLEDADRRAFAWFDGIGLPSSKGKSFVRVTPAVKESAEGAGGEDRSWGTDGFLLAEDATSWTVLRMDLWTETIRRDGDGGAMKIETLDLAGVAAAAAKRLHGSEDGHGGVDELRDRMVRGMSVRLGEHAEALALARHCAENGLDRAAKDLLEAARRLPRLRDGASVEGAIEEIAADELAESVLWKITLDFGETSVPRTQLLERMRAWRRSFPKSEHAPMADEAVRILEAMVGEDAAHAPLSDAAMAKLALDARARELIFRLRDQPGGQSIQPGSPSIFCYFGRADDTPADGLVAMGTDAVPALIDALVDERFTRCVGFWRDFCFSHYVVRVGDAALEILGRTTGQRFWRGTYTAASMVKDGNQKEVQARYRTWWAEVSGFLPPLRALLGEHDPAKRRELARTFPDRGPGPISGAPATAVWGTAKFVDAVPGLALADAKTVLRALVADAPHPRTRVLAAWALLDLGDRDVVADIAALWKSLDDSVRADPLQGGAVASFLASCGDAAGIRALGDGLDARPAAVRELAVLAFERGALGAVRGFAGGADGGIPVDWYSPGEASSAAEDVIAARLVDLDEDPLGKIPRQVPLCDMDKQFDCGRRIADLAVRVLSSRLPAAYVLANEPVHPAKDWESTRTTFLATWKARVAARPK
jgi:hypothetical protein